jgi:hypothetical protein
VDVCSGRSALPFRSLQRRSRRWVAAYAPDVDVDHACPVARAEKLGLLAGSPMRRSWCLSFHREVVAGLPRFDPANPDLLLWADGPLTVYYAPWDWVNTAARVMLVGITPGAHQAAEALREAHCCLSAGCSTEETLRRADAVGSFSGPMRANLVAMLDGAGLAGALGLTTTARLFDTHHHLAAHASAIDYPVFTNGRNYTGASPPLTRHPALRPLVRASLGARLAMVPTALVIPLGKAAQDAVAFLAAEGLVDPVRCLLGFPHPSGANGWRARQYATMRPKLATQISAWAATASFSPPAVPPPAAPLPPGLPTGRQPALVPAPAAEHNGTRVVIRLTEGSLRNGYVPLAAHLSFFPPDAMGAASAKDGIGTLLTLHFDGLPDTVHTDIAAVHKIFRSRGPWRLFFRHHALTADDSVTIERLSAYEYRITAAR